MLFKSLVTIGKNAANDSERLCILNEFLKSHLHRHAVTEALAPASLPTCVHRPKSPRPPPVGGTASDPHRWFTLHFFQVKAMSLTGKCGAWLVTN